MRRNFYDQDDPELLLRLKRQEADALRDVLRSINMSDLKTRQIFMIVQNTLLAQLGVRKMLFVYRTEEGLQYGMKRGIKPLDGEAELELPNELRVMKVDPEVHSSLHGLGVEYVVPINYRNEVNAWFLVAHFADSEAETENDLIFIETIGNVISTALENRSLITELVEQESLRRELEVAERIQQQLLVQDFSIVGEADVFARNFSHHKIGGDYFDLIPRAERGFFVCIADVAGKGIGAALLTANIQANLRSLILSENTLKSVVQKLNNRIASVTKEEAKFVTFFIAHVQPQKGEIDFVNAGHNPPLLVSTGEVQELKAATIPLGLMDLPDFEEGTVPYKPGDKLFLYTDGLVEQHNKEGEMFGEERIVDHLLSFGNEGAEAIIDSFKALYDEFSIKSIQDDDLTMMVVKF